MIKKVGRDIWQTARFWLKRIIVVVLGVWMSGIVLFSFLPVPYSAVMFERQIGAWFSGNFRYVAHQDWVAMDEISPYMALAVIAGEDQQFPQHWGFDFDAISSAFQYNGSHQRRIRGASTLSQQMTKNLFLWEGRSWVRKGFEAILTAGVELVWTKRRILTVYLNIAEFGPGVFGVEEAAQRYFNKPAKRLTASEAARLAAVLPNPILFNAQSPSAYTLKRQRWIERQMTQLGGKSFLHKYRISP